MEQSTSDSPDPGAAARALLGDEMASPPSAAPPSPPIETEEQIIAATPLPELPLEFGPDVAAIQRGTAWCLAASLVWGVLAGLLALLPELFASSTAHYGTVAILLLSAVAHLQGLSHLQRIEPIHRAREYLTLAWFLFVVLSGVSTIGFVLYQLQIDGGLIFGLSLLAWLTGVGSFWTLLFGLRRVAVYLAELRLISESYVCQILLGFILAASVVRIGSLVKSRLVRNILELLPEWLYRSWSSLSPTLLGAAGVMLLIYIHCLWLLWRACKRAQRQSVNENFNVN